MTDELCSRFQQHAWKTDACANCLKPKSRHEGSAPEAPRPTPARRQSKEPTAVASKTNNVVIAGGDVIEQKAKLEKMTNGGNSEDSVTAKMGAKPSPIKAKPSIGSKPTLSQKPAVLSKDSQSLVTGDSGKVISKSYGKTISKDSPLEAIENADSLESTCATNKPESSELVADLPSDFLTVSKSDCITNLAKNNCSGSPTAKFFSESKTSHYYQVYDITARNKEEEVELNSAEDAMMGDADTTAVGAKIKSSNRVHAMKMVEVAEEQIAMPYNVVDVTIRRPKASDCCPQLPLTPAPSDSNGFTGNTWPASGKHQPTNKEVSQMSSPVPRQRFTKMTESSKVVSEQFKPRSSGMHAQDDEVTDSDNCFDRYAHRVYEDIEDTKIPASTSVRNGQQSLSRATGAKSAAFEARVAALSTLDLGKSNSQKQVPGVSGSTEQSEGVMYDEKIASPSKKKTANVPVELSKPDKVRKKEGGKSFFHKLLKLGSKDSSKDVKDVKDITLMSDNSEKVFHSQKIIDGSIVDDCLVSESANPDILVSNAPACPGSVVINEKQAVLMNLKDCLVKRHMNTGVENTEQNSPASLAPNENVTPLSNITLHCETSDEHTDVIHKVEKTMFPVNDEGLVHETLCPMPAPRIVYTKIQPTQDSSDVLSMPFVQTSVTDELEHSSKEDLSCEVHGISDDVVALTVVTENPQMLDSFASPCSSSDAVSPTPSDQCLEGTDQLTRKKSRAEQKPGKQLRKTLGAPPPPPPTSPALVSEHDSSLLNDSGTVDLNTSSTPPSVPATFHKVDHPLATSEAEGTPLSHSLPRPISRKAQGGSSKLGSDQIVRRLDSATKHTRNKTVSEGIKLEEQLWSNGASDNKTDEERLLELVDRRASKFLNRALPEPPTVPSSNQNNLASPVEQSNGSTEVAYNLYELVTPSSTDPNCQRRQAGGETYEDIDAMSDAGPGTVIHRSQSNVNRSASKPHSASTKPIVDAEYLEPVLPPSENINWRPSPAARLANPPPVQDTSNVQATYVNCKDEKTGTASASEIPLTSEGCFSEINNCIRETLRCIAKRKYAINLKYMMTGSMNLTWSEFETSDTVTPHLSQNHVSFYRSWHQTVAPNGCVLMVLNMKPAKPMCEHLHLNVLSPITTFHESQFVDNSTVQDHSFDNVALLPFTDLMRFDEYWRKQHKLVLSGSLQAAHVERAICRTLAYLLSAAVFLHGCGWPKPRLDWNHVVMASTLAVPYGDYLPMLRPSMKTTTTSTEKSNVCSDVHQLISIMLEPDVVEVEADSADKLLCGSSEDDAASKPTVRRVDISSFLLTESPYARCLQRVLRCLQHRISSAKWDVAVGEALRLLEFVLWGPREHEARLAAVSEKRDEDLRNWLALSRCRLLAQLAVEENTTDVELIRKAQFLCDLTEAEILDVTKLLFFDP